MIKAVLFDVGSTLLFHSPDIDGVFYEAAQSRGHSPSLEELSAFLPEVYRFYEDEYQKDGDFWCCPEGSVEIYLKMYRYLCRHVGLQADAEGIAREVYRLYLGAAYWRIYEDVLPCLETLRERGLRLGVISNWGTFLKGLLCDLGLEPYFEVIIASADVGCRKPDPAIFELALERMGLAPHEVLYVGDNPEADGEGALAAGITPVIIDRLSRHEDYALTRISSLAELTRCRPLL